jgi:hypothetical protein
LASSPSQVPAFVGVLYGLVSVSCGNQDSIKKTYYYFSVTLFSLLSLIIIIPSSHRRSVNIHG